MTDYKFDWLQADDWLNIDYKFDDWLLLALNWWLTTGWWLTYYIDYKFDDWLTIGFKLMTDHKLMTGYYYIDHKLMTGYYYIDYKLMTDLLYWLQIWWLATIDFKLMTDDWLQIWWLDYYLTHKWTTSWFEAVPSWLQTWL